MFAAIEKYRTPSNEAIGATSGQNDMRRIDEDLRFRYLKKPEILVFDFAGISAVNASYAKATVLYTMACSFLDASEEKYESSDNTFPFSATPLKIIPMLANMQDEVAEEFDELLRGRNWCCHEALTWTAEVVISARLRGILDAPLLRTLRLLIDHPRSTAFDLDRLCPSERVTTNAWSNRLRELARLRMTVREKLGREWVYSPMVKELVDG